MNTAALLSLGAIAGYGLALAVNSFAAWWRRP